MGAEDVPLAAVRIWESPGAGWLVSGSVNSGKSGFVQRLVEVSRREFPERRIGGVICHGLFLGDAKVAYEGVDCLGGARFPMTIRRGLAPDGQRFIEETFADRLPLGGGCDIGPWRVLDAGLSRGREAIRQAVRLRCDLVVVDEFGPLELDGDGLRAAVDAVVESRIPLLLVVRECLVEDVRRLYGSLQTLPLPGKDGSGQ